MSCGFLASFFAWFSDSLFCQGFFFHSFSRKLYSSPVLHESFAGVCFLKLEVLCSFFSYFGIENDICISLIQIESKCTYSLSNIKCCCYCCFWTFSVLFGFKWKFFLQKSISKSDEPFLVERARNVNSIFSRFFRSFVSFVSEKRRPKRDSH